MIKRAVALLAVLAMAPLAAQADTLYQAAPPPAGPGHPIRLMSDHRASQVGDLCYIVFDFNDKKLLARYPMDNVAQWRTQ